MTVSLQDNIITKLGFNNLPTGEKADILMRMAAIIQKRLALRVMALLPDEALDEYLKIADNDEIGAHQFLSGKIPNYASVIEEEIAKFKQEITN